MEVYYYRISVKVPHVMPIVDMTFQISASNLARKVEIKVNI